MTHRRLEVKAHDRGAAGAPHTRKAQRPTWTGLNQAGWPGLKTCKDGCQLVYLPEISLSAALFIENIPAIPG
jgi:hypothetical protein